MNPSRYLSADLCLRGQNALMGFGRLKTRRTVARRIRDARLRAGITRAELAARLHCPVKQVAAIEQGQRRVDIDLLVRLARALRLDPVVLLRKTLD